MFSMGSALKTVVVSWLFRGPFVVLSAGWWFSALPLGLRSRKEFTAPIRKRRCENAVCVRKSAGVSGVSAAGRRGGTGVVFSADLCGIRCFRVAVSNSCPAKPPREKHGTPKHTGGKSDTRNHHAKSAEPLRIYAGFAVFAWRFLPPAKPPREKHESPKNTGGKSDTRNHHAKSAEPLRIYAGFAVFAWRFLPPAKPPREKHESPKNTGGKSDTRNHHAKSAEPFGNKGAL